MRYTKNNKKELPSSLWPYIRRVASNAKYGENSLVGYYTFGLCSWLSIFMIIALK